MEKNVTRSLGGKYGAIGNSPTTINDMMRQKLAAGLQAKSAKESFDLSKTMEANRKAESARNFGLEEQKFGFTQSESDKKWADAKRQYELQKTQMEGGWSQQELDRALREQQYGSDNEYRMLSLAEEIRQADIASRDRNASLAQQAQASQQAALLRQQQFDLQKQEAATASSQYDQQRQDSQDLLAYNRKQDEQNMALGAYGGGSGSSGSSGGGYGGGVNKTPSSLQEARLKNKYYEAVGLPQNAINEYNDWSKSVSNKIDYYNNRNE
jgi:hypothetical protein